ncbi:MAG: hypothetical protein GC165_19660 [Armatimonadetes bacterium]|nr:hypothetical protein [Armatimonadota bacterium]MBS1727976.1 hypothetical protein [Armatimonadota bacterium]
MRRKIFPLLGLLVFGCGQFPNPNDLATIPQENRAAIAYERLLSAEDTLQFKVQQDEISDERRNEMISEVAEQMLKSIKADDVPLDAQWKYASLLRVTNRWKETEAALKEAVKVAEDPDRKINDTLKLAQAEAKNGEVEEAIKTAASVMDAKDEDAAPILPSVLYEVVPAAQNKGHNKELVDLLSNAVKCHERVKVDPNSDDGRAFLIAKRYHIHKAEQKMTELLSSNG